MGEEGGRVLASTACRRSSPADAAPASSKSAMASASTRPPASLWRAVEPDLGAGRARGRSAGRERSRCSRAGHCASSGRARSAACGRSGATSAQAPRWRRRRCRTGGGRAGGAAAGRCRPCASSKTSRPFSARMKYSRPSTWRARNAASAPRARSRAAPRRVCSAMTAGAPAFRMPAFSYAIFSTVAPRNSGMVHRHRRDDGRGRVGRSRWWRRSGRRGRPPAADNRPGVSLNSRNAAAVVISNTEIDWPALTRSQRVERGVEPRVVDERPPAQPDALVEAHQMRRGVDMHALARRLQDRRA